jgi:multiple sugar transport system permease protein
MAMARQMSAPARQGQATQPRLGLSQRAQEEIAAYIFLLPWLLGFIIFTAGAMLYSLGLSFFQSDLLSDTRFVGLGNYTRLLDDDLFKQSVRVTALFTFLTVPIGTILALAIAMMLNQKVVALGFWRTAYYLPAVVSGIAVALIWSWVLQPEYGLLNNFLASIGIQGPRWFLSEETAIYGLVMAALWGTGTNMLLYLAGLQSIPTELHEAAKIDGANAWQGFWRVTLPLLTPTIFFNVIINIIGSFQAVETALILTDGGPNNATLTMVLYLYRNAFQLFKFGYASAIGWALFALVMVLAIIVIRSSDYWVHYEGGLRK